MKLIPIVVNNMPSRKTSSICIDMIEKTHATLELAGWIVSHNRISSRRGNIAVPGSIVIKRTNVGTN
jgi:hypothetical protein